MPRALLASLPRAAVQLSSLGYRAAPCTPLAAPQWRSTAIQRQRRPVGTVAAAAVGSGAALKAAVRRGDILTGLFLNASSPLVAEQLAHLDYDYLLVRGSLQRPAGDGSARRS